MEGHFAIQLELSTCGAVGGLQGERKEMEHKHPWKESSRTPAKLGSIGCSSPAVEQSDKNSSCSHPLWPFGLARINGIPEDGVSIGRFQVRRRVSGQRCVRRRAMRWTVQTANEEDSSTNELNVFSASCPSPMGLDPSTPSNNVKKAANWQSICAFFLCRRYTLSLCLIPEETEAKLLILAKHLIHIYYICYWVSPFMVLYIAFSLPFFGFTIDCHSISIVATKWNK